MFAYLGAALAGWPLAHVIERYGWPGMFVMLAIAATLIALLLTPLLVVNKAPPKDAGGAVYISDPQ